MDCGNKLNLHFDTLSVYLLYLLYLLRTQCITAFINSSAYTFYVHPYPP